MEINVSIALCLFRWIYITKTGNFTHILNVLKIHPSGCLHTLAHRETLNGLSGVNLKRKQRTFEDRWKKYV